MNDGGAAYAGMILAAGYGERMTPLSRMLPKPLLPVLGRPLFEIIVRKLLRAGARPIHANLHHLPDAIARFAAKAELPVLFHREREILGTAGGVGGMIPAVTEADRILLHNGDIIADIDFAPALAFHDARRPLVTLVLVPEGPAANVAVGDDGGVTGIGGDAPRSSTMLGYTGMAILSRASFPFFPRGRKAGLVEILNGMIARRPGSVAGWNAGAAGGRYAWGDCGSPGAYLDLHRRILVERTVFDPLAEPPAGPVYAAPDSVIGEEVTLRGFCAIGPRAKVGAGAVLEDCVVLEDTSVAAGARHSREVVYPGGSVRG